MVKKIKYVAMLLCIIIVFVSCTVRGNTGNGTPNFVNRRDEEEGNQGKLDAIRPVAYSRVQGLNLEPGSYISIIGRSASSEFWGEVRSGAEQAAEDINRALGFEGDDRIRVAYTGPSTPDDVDEQVNILDVELARNPIAVAIAIVDTLASRIQFDLAAENNIPIVAFDSGSDHHGIVSMCSTNNIEAAGTAAKKIGTEIGSGEVALFIHDSRSTSAKEREEGFLREIEENFSDVSVVHVYHLDDLEEMARVIAEELNAEDPENEVDPEDLQQIDVAMHIFEQNPNLRAVFGSNYDATQLIVAAMREMEKEPEDLMVVGFDAGRNQISALGEEIDGLVVQNPFGMGYAAVIAAARAALDMGNEAFVDTGYIWVTKENLEKREISRMLY